MPGTPETCGTGCAGESSSAFVLDRKTVAYSILAVLLFSQLAGLVFSRVVGGALGWYLRKAASGRRAHLVGLMQIDQDLYRKGKAQARQARGEDSEEVEAALEEEKGTDWRGIVGFFHPFWYAPTSPSCGCSFPGPGLTYRQQCRRRRGEGPMGRRSGHPATLPGRAVRRLHGRPRDDQGGHARQGRGMRLSPSCIARLSLHCQTDTDDSRRTASTSTSTPPP